MKRMLTVAVLVLGLVIFTTGADSAQAAGSDMMVLSDTAARVPWGSLVMLSIVVMSSAGCTVAIVRSVRRRR